MKRFLLIILLAVFLGEGHSSQEINITEGVYNFNRLHKLYIKWSDGFCGSRKYHKHFLKMFLNDITGNEIVTNHDYIVVSPDIISNRRIICRFRDYRWLHVHGEIDLESMKKYVKKDPLIFLKWWRTDRYVSLSGIIEKFRLNTGPWGYRIDLYLKKIFFN